MLILHWVVLALLFQTAAEGEPGRSFRPSDLAVRDSDTGRPPELLEPEHAGYDARLLQYALEHAYGGRRFVPEEDFARAGQELSRIAANPPTTPDDLCDAIADALWEIPDNHLYALAGARRCGTDSEKRRRRPSVGRNTAAAADGNRCWSLTQIETASRTVPVLSVTSFPDPDDPAWDGYTEALAGIRQSPALIVDLRGNPGGNDERGFELARSLLGREPRRPYDAVIRRQTPGALLLMWNPLRLAQLSERRRGKDLPAYLLEDLEEAGGLYQEALAGKLPDEEISEFAEEENHAADAYPNPVLLLADAGCASSCEDALLLLRGHHRAVTIGEPTGGYLHFGDVGSLVLPHSQLRIGIPTKHFRIRNAYYERRGIGPDLQLKAGSDALEAAKHWLAGYFSR